MSGVHQEELYFIHHEFGTYEVGRAKEFLNHHEPVGSTVDWWDENLVVSGFDSRDSAESFYKSLINYVDSSDTM